MEYDPETPLPDSDIVQETPSDETNVVSLTGNKVDELPPAAKRSWSHNDDFTVATMKEGDVTQSYDLRELPEKSAAYLRFIGMTTFCSRSDDVAKSFTRLMAGERLGVKGKAASVKVNNWHEAIALGIVDATKKAPAGQKTIEDARLTVAAMDKETIARLKLDPKVVTHFNKLTGGTTGSSLAAFLSASEAA